MASNFPIVCAVLVIDNWNYCCGEQGLTVQHMQDCLIPFIQLNYTYNVKQNKVLPPYHLPLPQSGTLPVLNEAT